MSFTIKCDKCEKEQRLKGEEEFDELSISLYADVSLFGGEYSKAIIITCECENSVDEKTYISS